MTFVFIGGGNRAASRSLVVSGTCLLRHAPGYQAPLPHSSSRRSAPESRRLLGVAQHLVRAGEALAISRSNQQGKQE